MLENTLNSTLRMIACPECGLALDPAVFRPSYACPKCKATLEGTFFGRYWSGEGLRVHTGQIAVDGEAVCFFHGGKKAALSCERCGRFVCALCDMELNGEHVCPACLDRDLQHQTSERLITNRFCWWKLALSMGYIPMVVPFLWLFTILAGPAAIICGIWGWNRPSSLVTGRRRWALVLGIIGGVIQTAAFVLVVFAGWRAN